MVHKGTKKPCKISDFLTIAQMGLNSLYSCVRQLSILSLGNQHSDFPQKITRGMSQMIITQADKMTA